ncbi:MAG: patatin-like phospholipase family protein [Alphaproteobacteria bacterium]|nr:patatin-like phospholipase family protein [Alphaproteobacteria bacterium]
MATKQILTAADQVLNQPTKEFKDGKKHVSIAMQGGGAHGAFAWGVMDRLLEEDDIYVEGVCGTSAGGMNSAAVVDGLVHGGNAGARAKLDNYWREMVDVAKISPYKLNPIDKYNKYYNLDRSPGPLMMNFLGGFLSPYQMNPMNYNPFLDFIRRFFDFQAVRENSEHKIFLGATHVKTGRVKIFSNDQFCADALMASACLPFMYQAVQVDGEYYWDGGYIANPAIYPLIYNCEANDIILIQLTRTHCEEIPRDHAAIQDRYKEITYNNCLVREMRSIRMITKMIDAGIIKDNTMKRMNIHLIKNEDAFRGLNLSSALNTDWDFLQMLKAAGRATADHWLKAHKEKIGTRQNTIDEEVFSEFV